MHAEEPRALRSQQWTQCLGSCQGDACYATWSPLKEKPTEQEEEEEEEEEAEAAAAAATGEAHCARRGCHINLRPCMEKHACGAGRAQRREKGGERGAKALCAGSRLMRTRRAVIAAARGT